MSYLHCPSFFHEAIITDFCLRLYFEQTLCGSRLIPPKEFIRLAWLHCTPLPLSYPECFSSGERSSTCDVSGWRTDLPIRSRSPSRSYFHHKSRKKEKKRKKRKHERLLFLRGVVLGSMDFRSKIFPSSVVWSLPAPLCSVLYTKCPILCPYSTG